MVDPSGAGRPLTEREARDFARLVDGFSGSAAHDPQRAVAHRPLTWRQVVLVLAASAVFALLTATLPAPLNLWSPVVVLLALSSVCVLWGRRAERRGP